MRAGPAPADPTLFEPWRNVGKTATSAKANVKTLTTCVNKIKAFLSQGEPSTQECGKTKLRIKDMSDSIKEALSLPLAVAHGTSLS